MGSGAWSECSFRSYACSMGRGYDDSTKTYAVNYTNSSQAYTSHRLDEALDPKNVVRECCDSDEHPDSFPVILALDVTGSMGDTAIKIQKQLNPIMQKLYESVKDIEIAVMAIGDLSYDNAPIQVSQFESDIRIADNLDKIYFEGGGGGNNFESYTAAWYVGSRMTKLDCWKRGKKGVIITMGDEPINPYLPKNELCESVGGSLQSDVDTKDLYEEVKSKYDVYHICVKSQCYPIQGNNVETFAKVIGPQHVLMSDVEHIQDKIISIIQDCARTSSSTVELITDSTKNTKVDENGNICW